MKPENRAFGVAPLYPDISNSVCPPSHIADLCFFDGGRLSVAHRANIKTLLSLEVSLSEELVHDSLGPLPVQRQWLGRVAQVSAMHQVL